MNLSDAEIMALKLMREHNLQGWSFQFDRSVRRFGVCKYGRKIIGLSAHLTMLNNVENVRDTILHEIAHAIAGHKAGHGYEWKKVCIRIGAKPERCYDSEETVTPKLRYSATCGACGKEYQRSRAITHSRKVSCKCQSGKDWSNRVLLEFKERY